MRPPACLRFAILTLPLAASAAFALPEPALRLEEAGIHVVLQDGASAVVLPFENGSGAPARVRVTLEWVDPQGRVESYLEQTGDVRSGSSRLTARFPLSAKGDPQKIWHRLRYRVRGPGLYVSGILAFAQIAKHAFELDIAGNLAALAGGIHRVSVGAFHPVSHRPVAGVRMRGRLDLEPPVEAQAVTGEDGTAELQFRIPAGFLEVEGAVKIEGTLGDFSQSADSDVRFDSFPRIGITTDKPIYQPGQAVHVRLLCLTPQGRAAAALPVRLDIIDPDEQPVFAARLTTTRFGIAATDWRIPENLRLGDYTIRAAHEADPYRGRPSLQIKVSRYDLPQFTVTAKPDRPYYLPGQDAAIEVHADYLFGRPVPRGHVRIVRESVRTWDYGLQKWDIEEEESYEGQADGSGQFRTTVPLAEAHKSMAEGQRRYQDLTFAAYVRDPSSGRTEQRRFEVRVTRDRIHIYPIDYSGSGQLYVSTSYADGKPAPCRVAIAGGVTVTTNRYGVARVPALPDSELIELSADDGQGATGRWQERFWGSRGEPELSLRTDKTLYHPGEPIRVEISSAEPQPIVAFQVFKGDRLLEARWLSLVDQRATVEVAWRPEFVHEINVAATMSTYSNAGRTVLFPQDSSLRLGIRADRAVYRPGEQAAVALEITDPSGQPAEGALGVSVVDTAVAERTRTDAESARSLFRWWGGGQEELGGVEPEDLERLDTSRPFPDDLDLLAEVLFCHRSTADIMDRSVDYAEGVAGRFARGLAAQFDGLRRALDAAYKRDYTHPRDHAALVSLAASAGTDIDALRDPWGSPFRLHFDSAGPSDRIVFESAGPDKAFGTADDFDAQSFSRSHFQPLQDAIGRALEALPAFPASEQEARDALRAGGIDLGQARDSWGTMYRIVFLIERTNGVLTFRAAGPDGRFDTDDDFTAATFRGEYFRATHRKLSDLLADANPFPRDETSWNRLLRAAGLTPLKDPWDRPLYARFSLRFRYTAINRFYTAAPYGGKAETRQTLVPVTERDLSIELHSAGPDGVRGTEDDFPLALFSRVEHLDAAQSEAHRLLPAGAAKGGAIAGQVTDPAGATIPDARVRAVLKARDSRDGLEFEATADEFGYYTLSGLPPGHYDVRIESPGFQLFLVTAVPVVAGRVVRVDALLRIGAATQTVSVTAAVPVLATSDSAVSGVVSNPPRSTPRLREYFPETLVWEPLLETGADGRAQLRFKLADNITTWRLAAIASTEAGEIGTAETDIRAFQPFFVDHSPPRILTVGDEIELPVSIRNYLEAPQTAAVSLNPEPWIELLGPPRRELRIAPGESANAVFRFRAVSAVTDGKQRVTATAAQAADAIEKPVSVHPNGRELVETTNEVLRDGVALNATIPAMTIEGSARAELRIYPSLMSHVLESIEGILRRPYGCGEQTISAAYPSLLLLRHLPGSGSRDSPLALRARKYLEESMERLRAYRGTDGGFSYWGRGDSDLALTAYALLFLREARELVIVDDLVASASEFLTRSQRRDGSWPAHDWSGREDAARTSRQTALIALGLAGTGSAEGATRALDYLEKRLLPVDEPYGLALFALAARQNGDRARAERAVEALRRLARQERGLTYWHLEASTPFWGWGTAGRLETTALALRALVAAGRDSDQPMVNRALVFLLRSKDRYGVWHSTQATVQALQAVLEAAREERPSPAGTAEVRVNDRLAGTLAMPATGEVAPPLRLDLSPHLAPGANRVTIARAQAGSLAQAQVVTSYWVPWTGRTALAGADPLRLRVSFDKTVAAAGDLITCTFEAERVGSAGYGMLLGEIGLPPGADVDRESLDRAIADSGYALNRYDILPDRVIVYVWPRAGGARFRFTFRPRFGLRARSGASTLYDYYNPEASTVQAPAFFRVSAARAAE